MSRALLLTLIVVWFLVDAACIADMPPRGSQLPLL